MATARERLAQKYGDALLSVEDVPLHEYISSDPVAFRHMQTGILSALGGKAYIQCDQRPDLSQLFPLAANTNDVSVIEGYRAPERIELYAATEEALAEQLAELGIEGPMAEQYLAHFRALATASNKMHHVALTRDRHVPVPLEDLHIACGYDTESRSRVLALGVRIDLLENHADMMEAILYCANQLICRLQQDVSLAERTYLECCCSCSIPDATGGVLFVHVALPDEETRPFNMSLLEKDPKEMWRILIDEELASKGVKLGHEDKERFVNMCLSKIEKDEKNTNS